MKPETRKEEIINTAAKLFKEKGFSAVTMRDIAKAMGIKAASLYNHIDSKQEVLACIILYLAKEFTESMQNIKSSNTTNIDKLKDIIALHIRLTINNPYKMASLNSEWMHLERTRQEYFDLKNNYEENFRAILNDAIANNEIENVDIEVILFSILTTLRSLYLWIPKKEYLEISELKDNLNQVLLNGIVD